LSKFFRTIISKTRYIIPVKLRQAGIQKHLGDQEVGVLKETWQKGFKPVPASASFEDRYEAAYGNWIWIVRNTYNFIRRQMGEDGIKKFQHAEVEALKRKNAGPALFLLKLVRAFSPGTAFTMTARQMGYQLQWLNPFSVSELTRERAVLNIPRCKILDFPETEDICFIGCQSTYPIWTAEQFRVKMKFDRQGNRCLCTLAPLK